MGETMRRYWIPAFLVREIPEPDSPPVRVRLLGEDLVAFRDSNGRIELLGEYCPHRRTSLFFGRNDSSPDSPPKVAAERFLADVGHTSSEFLIDRTA